MSAGSNSNRSVDKCVNGNTFPFIINVSLDDDIMRLSRIGTEVTGAWCDICVLIGRYTLGCHDVKIRA